MSTPLERAAVIIPETDRSIKQTECTHQEKATLQNIKPGQLDQQQTNTESPKQPNKPEQHMVIMTQRGRLMNTSTGKSKQTTVKILEPISNFSFCVSTIYCAMFLSAARIVLYSLLFSRLPFHHTLISFSVLSFQLMFLLLSTYVSPF